MPYISQYRREDLGGQIISKPQSAGELNFVISEMVNDYIQTYGLSYSTINEVIGMLECAKLELYRRVASPYEDKKIQQNGDVYG